MEELEGILEIGAVAAVELAASTMAARGEKPMTCLNCGKPMIGPYCAICGQPHNTHRRTLKHLVQEVVKDIVSFDSRILRTTKALLWQPGELPKAFREGRTQPYVPAVRLYLFVSLLFFLFLSVTGLAFVQLGLQIHSEKFTHDQAGNVIRIVNGKPTAVTGFKSDAKGNVSLTVPHASNVKIPDMKADGHTITNTVTTKVTFFERIGHLKSTVSPDVKAALEQIQKEALSDKEADGPLTRGIYSTLTKLETDPAALNGPLTTWIPRILFVLLPLFAALLALFYRKQRKDFLFVDHLVFSLTMHSFVFVVLIGAAVAAQVLSSGWLAVLTWVVISVYFFLSLKYFYGQGWVKTGFKSVGITFIYVLFFLSPALAIAVVASVVGGG
jgi:hypothetical protein